MPLPIACCQGGTLAGSGGGGDDKRDTRRKSISTKMVAPSDQCHS